MPTATQSMALMTMNQIKFPRERRPRGIISPSDDSHDIRLLFSPKASLVHARVHDIDVLLILDELSLAASLFCLERLDLCLEFGVCITGQSTLNAMSLMENLLGMTSSILKGCRLKGSFGSLSK